MLPASNRPMMACSCVGVLMAVPSRLDRSTQGYSHSPRVASPRFLVNVTSRTVIPLRCGV
jgi:hypothetical protein